MADGDKKKTACVTRGNGYIASALIKMLLEKGYAVKMTVRNPDDMEKNSHLKDLQALGHLEVFRADLDEDGSFDDAEKLRTTALLDVLACIAGVPGVQGASGEGGVQVRGGAPHQPRHRLPRRHRRRGAGTQGDEAEFAVLDANERATGCVPLVHDDDLCRAEQFVAEEDAAAGRYICCSLNTTIAELARFLADKYPQYGVKTNLLSGELLQKPRVRLSSEKLVREGFEFRYRTLDDMYDDMVEYGKALGILPS